MYRSILVAIGRALVTIFGDPVRLFSAGFLIIGFVAFTVWIPASSQRDSAFASQFIMRYPKGICGGLFLNFACDQRDNMTGIVSTVRDYQITCTSWFGGTATCPGENIRVNVNATQIPFSLACQFYHVNDTLTVQKDIHAEPNVNDTVTFKILNGPC